VFFFFFKESEKLFIEEKINKKKNKF